MKTTIIIKLKKVRSPIGLPAVSARNLNIFPHFYRRGCKNRAQTILIKNDGVTGCSVDYQKKSGVH